MPRYHFSVTHLEDNLCEVGTVRSGSLAEAVEAINEHVSVHRGDKLEIGVPGFPPAQFECVWTTADETPFWQQTQRLAA